MSDTVAVIIVFDVTVVYLLLLGAVKLYGGRTARLRMLLASLLAASYSGAVASGILAGMSSYSVRMAVLTASGILAFGWKRDGIWKTSVFLLLNAAFEGVSNSHQTASALLRLTVAAAIALLCCILRRGGKMGKLYSRVEIRYGDRTVCVDALRDTGNDLRDILTGEPVIVVGPDAAFRLTGLTRMQLADPLDSFEKRLIKGSRLIPFSSVGNSCGLMLGVRPGGILVDGMPMDMVIAMAPEGMGKYEALIGGYHGL